MKRLPERPKSVKSKKTNTPTVNPAVATAGEASSPPAPESLMYSGRAPRNIYDASCDASDVLLTLQRIEGLTRCLGLLTESGAADVEQLAFGGWLSLAFDGAQELAHHAGQRAGNLHQWLTAVRDGKCEIERNPALVGKLS